MKSIFAPFYLPRVDVYFYLFVSLCLSKVFIFSYGYIFTGDSDVLSLFFRWDCAWYRDIVGGGYYLEPAAHEYKDAANWAFFPAFPLAVMAMSKITTLNYMHSGYLLNFVFCFLTVILLFKWISEQYSEATAKVGILFFLFNPAVLYFTIPYTEIMFFYLFLLTLYYAGEHCWGLVGLTGALLTATRNLGVLIIIPLAFIWVRQAVLLYKNDEKEYGTLLKGLIGIMCVPLGLSFYMIFLYIHVGDALAFANVQIAWDRFVRNPIDVFFVLKFTRDVLYYQLMTILGLCGVFCLLLKKRYALSLVFMIMILAPLSTSLFSMPRYVLSSPPFYVFILDKLNDSTRNVKIFIILAGLVLEAFHVSGWLMNYGFAI